MKIGFTPIDLLPNVDELIKKGKPPVCLPTSGWFYRID